MAETPGRRLTRQELYDLVWSGPISGLPPLVGVSTVTIAKACREMYVPTPPQGYWLRQKTGKNVSRIPLPRRPPGLADDLMFGGGPYWRVYRPSLSDDELLGPVPPEPSFDESLDEIRKRVEASVKKILVPKDMARVHPVVGRLLAQDEAKRQKTRGQSYVMSWDEAVYESPAQQRRLRIASAILMAAAGLGCSADMAGTTAMGAVLNDFYVKVGHQRVTLRAEVIEVSERVGKGADAKARRTEKIRISLSGARDGKELSWLDGEIRLEQHATEIVQAIIVQGEEQHRRQVLGNHAWRISAQANLIERHRMEREEAERRERERLVNLEREQLERLLEEAEAFRRAEAIRRYVAEARSASERLANPMSPGEIDRWASWALDQADRIDPVVNGDFRVRYAV